MLAPIKRAIPESFRQTPGFLCRRHRAPSMDCTTALLCLLGMVGMARANPISSSVCRSTMCELVPNATRPLFVLQLVLELQNDSVAPWGLRIHNQSGRTPESIVYANCEPCKLHGFISKPIFVKLFLPEEPQRRSGRAERGSAHFCLCPYDLAVGCTCVPDPDKRPAPLPADSTE